MRYDEFAALKDAARKEFGPGTLICYLSAETLQKIQTSILEHGADLIELSQGVVFRLDDSPGVRFFLKEERKGPTLVYA